MVLKHDVFIDTNQGKHIRDGIARLVVQRGSEVEHFYLMSVNWVCHREHYPLRRPPREDIDSFLILFAIVTLSKVIFIVFVVVERVWSLSDKESCRAHI